jgi:hypothetical protein
MDQSDVVEAAAERAREVLLRALRVECARDVVRLARVCELRRGLAAVAGRPSNSRTVTRPPVAAEMP